jgi:hypothetical protein
MILEQACILSMKITGIYMACREGMIFGNLKARLATFFDWIFGLKMSKIVQKPLWDCLICMSSFWTIIMYARVTDYSGFYSIDLIDLVEMILVVCGINAIIDKLIEHDF